MWKTRTRTKILTFSLIYIGILIGAVITGWLFLDRSGAAEIIIALTSGGAGMFIFHVVVIGKENTCLKKNEEIDYPE